jgi:hypothetical protein
MEHVSEIVKRVVARILEKRKQMSDPVEIEDCVVKHATDKAILVAIPDFGDVWIQQSQIHDDSEVWKKGDTGTLVITRWCAEQKELV